MTSYQKPAPPRKGEASVYGAMIGSDGQVVIEVAEIVRGGPTHLSIDRLLRSYGTRYRINTKKACFTPEDALQCFLGKLQVQQRKAVDDVTRLEKEIAAVEAKIEETP